MTAASALHYAAAEQGSRAYRLQQMDLRVDGTPLDFSRYPYLIHLLDKRCRRKTIRKGAQLGFTVTFVLDAVLSARDEDLRGIGYFFPTESDVFDFSKARFGPIVGDNEAFAGLVDTTDSAGLKRVGNTHIYFRPAGAIGASTKHSLSRVKSIPLDRVYLDERDEMQDARVEAIEHRLDGSLIPESVELSTPTIPGYGVDLAYKASNQETWHWKCPSCGEWTCLELTWPECIAEPSSGEPYYLCSGCRELLRRVYGEPIAKHPGITEHLGLWVSQLCSPTKTAGDILQNFKHAESIGRRREFYNQVLARPFAQIEDQLTPEAIGECLTEEPRARSSEGPTCAGADPGARDIHWWVKERIGSRDSRTLNYGQCSGFDELAQISKRYNVQVGVVDQMAEKRAVREFLDSHLNWWGCQYSEGMRGSYSWNGLDRVVSVNRTEALDASHRKIIEKREKLPAPNEIYHNSVVPQLCNLARVKKEDSQSGQITYRWVVIGGMKNDHIKHAHTYATIAEERVGLAAEIQRARTPARRVQTRRSFMSA